MPQQARAEITRKQVMEGAARSFDKLGFGGASLSGILAYANVTKGALYFHFDSKEALAQAIIGEQHAMAMEGAGRAVAASSTATEAIIRSGHEMARQLMEEPIARAGIRLSLEIGVTEHPDKKPFIDWADAVAQMAAQAVKDGELRPSVDAAGLGRVLSSSFTGLQLVSQAMCGRADLFDRLAELWRFILPGIATEESLPRLLEIATSDPTPV
ncbi:ScbR family autoregulator-binding transcription factor [Rhodococcus sp. NPDC058521]|uniref:ScbR family autoregulator-binding transcription factor n=1 Tax=Rhodococcus sp. NPDC058521 TaxID=3346536 RepID=UPI003647F5D2